MRDAVRWRGEGGTAAGVAVVPVDGSRTVRRWSCVHLTRVAVDVRKFGSRRVVGSHQRVLPARAVRDIRSMGACVDDDDVAGC